MSFYRGNTVSLVFIFISKKHLLRAGFSLSVAKCWFFPDTCTS